MGSKIDVNFERRFFENHYFSKRKTMFFEIQQVQVGSKNGPNIDQKSFKIEVWRAPEQVWKPLGPSWAIQSVFGTILDVLEVSWSRLGGVLEASWAVLG